MNDLAPDDKCELEEVFASCQHIKFVEQRVETSDGIEIRSVQQIPPGTHYLFGTKITNSTASVMEKTT